MKENVNSYWFTIEPYVFIGLTDQCALLYNTLDGVTIESDKIEVINLLSETIQEENCGVVLLTKDMYLNENINSFIVELRKKYMGDIIDVTLSKGKPVQLMPLYNFSVVEKLDLYKRHSFSSDRNILKHLIEINIHINSEINTAQLLSFLKSISGVPILNIIGNIKEIENYNELLIYLDSISSVKNIICSYKHLIDFKTDILNNMKYTILVSFPISEQKWNGLMMVILNQNLPIEYVFEVSSVEDFQKAKMLVEKYHIEKYEFSPIYTGENISFFEENVFLSKDDILSTTLTIKDFFSHQAINLHDFGKINILPNGDVYANLNHPLLGNIYSENIYDIVYKEINNGKSWFNIRNHSPCDKCVYQWFCPSPSNYEIILGRSNLCHIKNNKK